MTGRKGHPAGSVLPTIETIGAGLKPGEEIPVAVLPDWPITYKGFPVEPGEYRLVRSTVAQQLWLLAPADAPVPSASIDLEHWAKTYLTPGGTAGRTVRPGETVVLGGSLLPAGDWQVYLDRDGEVVRAERAGVDHTPAEPEAVDHPAHYGGADDPYEAIKVIEAWGLGFHLGTVLKYLARAGSKPGESLLKDLKKARWYLDRKIARIEAGGE